MDEDGFWKIVQRVHDSSGGDMDQKWDALRQQFRRCRRTRRLSLRGCSMKRWTRLMTGRYGARLTSSMAVAATIPFPIFAPR